MCPPPAEDPIQAAIERSRQRREEAIRRETTEKKKVVPTGDIGRPAPPEPRREATSAPDLEKKPKQKRTGEAKRKRAAKGGPDLVAEPKRKKGGDPQMVREAERKKGGGPQMVMDAERKKGGAPEMILEPERKKSAGPEMVLEPERKKSGAPELVEVPQEKKGGASEMIQTPQARKGGDAELVESPKLRKGADPVMIKVPQREAAAASRRAGTDPDSGAELSPAGGVVAALAKQLEGTIGKQGGGWDIAYAEPFSIALRSGAKSLTLHFQSEEATFDTLEILETRTLGRRERKSGMLSGLKRMFGGSSAQESAELRERLILGRNPGRDGRTFEWDTDAAKSVLNTVNLSVTADYEDQNRHYELEIRLGHSNPGDAGESPLSRGGAVRAVNAVFAALHEALSS